MSLLSRDLVLFVVRLVVGGTLVASIPWVAQRWSPQVAGVLVLFPAVTVAGFTVLWSERGSTSVEDAALAGLWAAPTVAVYLASLWLLLRAGWPYVPAMAAAVSVWVLAALAVVAVRGRLL